MNWIEIILSIFFIALFIKITFCMIEDFNDVD
jgi:hypothetical protein